MVTLAGVLHRRTFGSGDLDGKSSVDLVTHDVEHRNAFGFLRLLFASLVIVAHTPELVDGDRSRELLTRVTGTMSFGELAVDGFFIISGFLITGSFIKSRSIRSYAIKRMARIYPAFVVAWLISLLVVGQVGGGYFEKGPLQTIVSAVARLALLARPAIGGAFPDQHHSDYNSALNGAMWTLQYEALCYVLVVPMVIGGAIRRPMLLSLAAATCLLISSVVPKDEMLWVSTGALLPGPAAAVPRLMGMFLAGATFYACRERLRFRPWPIAVAMLGLVATLPVGPFADLGFAAFGGYLILATANLAGGTWLGRVNNRSDISYGIYLYGWPVQRLLMAYLPGLWLPVLGVLTWSGAALLAVASWFLVEQPSMKWARDTLRGRKQVGQIAS